MNIHVQLNGRTKDCDTMEDAITVWQYHTTNEIGKLRMVMDAGFEALAEEIVTEIAVIRANKNQERK